jgi:hypothetical protein
MWRKARAVALAILALPAPETLAQTIEVRVVEEVSRRALPGVVVRLVRNGRAEALGLSNESGRLVLRAPGPGTYQLLASRIGHEPAPPVRLVLQTGTVQQVIEMPRAVRMLPAITVSGISRCERSPREGSLAAALWQEIETALSANRITAEQGLQILHTVRYQRDRDSLDQVIRERVTGSAVTRGQPFVALPARDLARRGFVYRQQDGIHYAAPDAALLLADEFVNRHCFRVNPSGPAAGLIGLAFEPVVDSRRPDVRGTLWIDRESRELRYLEYSYTSLEGPQALGNPGGEIRFLRLESGAWIVSEWFIRMPLTGELRNAPLGSDRYVLLGWVEQGGRASVRPPPPRETEGRRFTVEGEVYDSLHHRGLAGALVTIDGEPDSGRTDQRGTFRLSVAGPGQRLLRVTHPLLGLVRDNSTREIVLPPERPVTIRVDVPSPASFARTFCAGEEAGAGVVGMVTDTAGAPAPARVVRAVWHQVPSGRVERGAVSRSLSAETGPRGEFAFCNLPRRQSVRIELLAAPERVLHRVEVFIQDGFQWVDLPQRP